MVISVRVLGPLEVERDGRLARLPGVREKQVLALLAAHYPRAVSVEGMVAQLWGVSPPAGAERTVRAYVSKLRRALRASGLEEIIVTARGGYRLSDTAGERLDARAFEARVALAGSEPYGGDLEARIAMLQEALALWRGPPFSEVAFAPEVAPVAEYLEEARLAAQERLLAWRLERGEHEAVALELSLLCEREPLRESLWERRMLALYRCGRQAEALGAYREARRQLDDQLGIEPGAGLRSLELAILRHDPSLELPAGRRTNPSAVRRALPRALRSAPGPLLGRDAELEALEVGWGLTREGAGRVVMVCGEPGIGKTALVSELAARLRPGDATILASRCHPDAAVPYQPFRDALRDRPAGDALPEALERLFEPVIARHVAESSLPLTGHDPASARLSLFEALTAGMLDAAARVPTLLILEDLHWAEPSTLLGLRHLARHVPAARLMIVGTYRHTETDISELGQMLEDLDRDPGLTTLTLGGIAEGDVFELLTRVPRPAADEDREGLAAVLHRYTAGNPLFVRQMIAHLALAPDMFLTEGGAPRSDPPAPPGVREVIARRLALLPPVTQRILVLASVIGTEFELGLLQATAGPDGTLAELEHASAAGLVNEAGGAAERYAFAHELIRQTIYEDLSQARRARLHQHVGEALEAVSAGEPTRLAAIAEHHAAAARPGHTAQAAAAALRAGRQAVAQLAFAEAAMVAERGLRCLGLDSTVDLEARCELELLLAEARLLARDIHACKQAAARAGADARALGSPRQLARAAITGSYLNTFGTPTPDTAQLCEDALAAIGDSDPAASVHILSGYADYLASSAGDAAKAERLSAQALSLARRQHDSAALARALFVHGEVIGWTPRTEERSALAGELLTLAEYENDMRARANGHHIRALARLESGDLAGFDHDHQQIDTLRSRIDYWYTDLFATLWRGMRALLDGRLDDVEPLAHDVLGHARHEPNVVNLYVGQILFLRREQRRLHELLPLVQDAIKHNPDIASFRCVLALLHIEADQPRLAAAQLAHLAPRGFAAVPRDATYTTSLAVLAEVAATLGDRPRARVLARLLAPYTGRLLIATKGIACLGAADRYLAMLAATTGDHEAAHRLFESALALEGKVGSEMLQDRTRACRTAAEPTLS